MLRSRSFSVTGVSNSWTETLSKRVRDKYRCSGTSGRTRVDPESTGGFLQDRISDLRSPSESKGRDLWTPWLTVTKSSHENTFRAADLLILFLYHRESSLVFEPVTTWAFRIASLRITMPFGSNSTVRSYFKDEPKAWPSRQQTIQYA